MKMFLACFCLLLCVLACLPCRSDEPDAAFRQRDLRTMILQPFDPILPDGHNRILYLDCGGFQREISADGVRLAVLSGEEYAFPGPGAPVATALFDPERVVFELRGLDPEKEYVLGFTWWDGDDSGRVQSVQFSTIDGDDWQTVLPPVPAAAFNADASTWARVLLPLTPPYNQGEALRVAFVNESGPNAVVNELWLMERVAREPVKRVLIVTGDDYAGHDWRATAPALAGALREDARLEVTITESPAIYGSPLLAHYDATVIHFKNYDDRLPLGAAITEGLLAQVKNGQGLALSHFACGAFQEWDEFVRIAGRVWNPALRAHDPYGSFTVRISDAGHPVTRELEEFDVPDELYTCLDGDTPIRVLCEATSVVDQQVYPMAFVVDRTDARVFHCVLGHDAGVYETPGARALYRRGVAWAAGLDPETP